MQSAEHALFEVALEAFCAQGVDAVSFDDLAGALDESASELRNRFESSDEVFDSAVETMTRPLISELHEIAEQDLEPAQRLVGMVRRLATGSRGECLAIFAVVRELVAGQERAERAFATSLGEGYELLLQVLGEGQFRKQIVPLPPRLLVTLLFSGIVLPQVSGYAQAEGVLQGIHQSSETRSALLAVSLEATFAGILIEDIDLDVRPALH